jgi:hypothetical protein
MKISNCCGAEIKDFEETGICPLCKEHCQPELFRCCECGHIQEDGEECEKCESPILDIYET